jgi:pyroglutamyl-peptidase
MTSVLPRLLLTAFEPFGGEPVNPSQLLAERLRRDPVAGFELHTVLLPVDIVRLPAALDDAVRRVRPDLSLLVGQATGRGHVCLESLAVNRVCYGDAVDNGGTRVTDAPVEAEGPDQLGSTLDLARLARELDAEDLPVKVSTDAGRYLCNLALYRMLLDHPDVPAAFVHVPLLPEQAARRGMREACLDLELMERCLRSLIEHLDRPSGASAGLA